MNKMKSLLLAGLLAMGFFAMASHSSMNQPLPGIGQAVNGLTGESEIPLASIDDHTPKPLPKKPT